MGGEPEFLPGPGEDRDFEDDLNRELALAFAPLHKSAFGFAVGLTFGVGLFVVTALAVVRGGPPDILSRVRFLIPLHDVSWSGAILGSLSASFAFFCAGWFLAFVRNLVLALSIWVLRTRAELDQTQDFLDHI
jgi:hypothetical protein